MERILLTFKKIMCTSKSSYGEFHYGMVKGVLQSIFSELSDGVEKHCSILITYSSKCSAL